jgi:hypothetical protein
MGTPETPKTPDELRWEREERIARILRSVEEQLRREFPDAPQTLDEIERSAEQLGEQIKREIQHEMLDLCGTGYCGKFIPCSCGGTARFKSVPVRSVVTLHGEEPLARAYYYCSACRRGRYPLDDVLKLGTGQCSTHVRALACRFASYLPFALATRELEMVCGVKLSASSVQRIAKQTGRQLLQDWQERIRQPARQQMQQVEAMKRIPQQLHISMDGVMAHVDGAWREVKLGVCYERAGGSAGEKGPTKASYCATYCATLSNSHEFGRQLRTLAHQAGEPRCRKVAVVADGSDWIWRETGKHFTQRVQILDFFHVCEHLWALANAHFGEGSPEASAWIHAQKGRLLENKVAEMLSEIRSWPPRTPAIAETQRKELAYLSKHAHRMRYKTFEDAGYHIGSGVMESSCRWVVQQRMKGSGMRWSSEGAESMLQLRTAWCSRSHNELMDAARSATLHA